MRCPKCDAASPSRPVVAEELRSRNVDPDSPEAVFGSWEVEADRVNAAWDFEIRRADVDFDEIHTCPVHGDFAIRADGSALFAEPDCFVTGPNGERLFRT